VSIRTSNAEKNSIKTACGRIERNRGTTSTVKKLKQTKIIDLFAPGLMLKKKIDELSELLMPAILQQE
jgi:hypothetical protein